MKKSKIKNEIKTEYLIPERIVAAEGAEGTEILLEEQPRQAVIGKTAYVTMREKSWFLVDFGEELQGGILLCSGSAEKETMVRVVFGESVSEALSTLGVKNASNDHSLRDRITPMGEWEQLYFGDTGFRFVKIEVVTGSVNILGLQGLFKYRDLEYRGYFISDDERLNQIWKTGAKTVHLNMQEYIWDGIKRDRLVWMGDMHPETSVIASVFGYCDCVEKSLDLIRDHTKPEEWMNCWYPGYNLWWIIIQYEWYMETGRKSYLLEQKDYLHQMLAHYFDLMNEDGTHRIAPTVCEWSSCDTRWQDAGFQALLVIAFGAAEKLCRFLEEESSGTYRVSQEGSNQAAALQKAAGPCVYQKDADRCAFYKEKAAAHCPPYSGNKQVAAMAGLAGLDDPEKIAEEVILPGGASGLSTFWGFYALKLLAKTGHMTEAMEIIKDYWGGMLDFGATTFWEDFDLEWTRNAFRIDQLPVEGKDDIHGDFGKFCYKQFRHSLCHGWAGGPTAFLSHQVLGIEPLEPGYRKVRIAPNLGSLKQVEAGYPTPFGILQVKARAEGEKIRLEINAPEGVEVVSAAD